MGFYQLHPFLIEKPWGGGHLDFLSQDKTKQPIGEMVLISDLAEFVTPVTEISITGAMGKGSFLSIWQSKLKPIFFQHYPQHKTQDGHFPFMAKILSTKEPLSVQVHPSDEDVSAMGLPGSGKWEAWRILEVGDDAIVYLGLRDEVLLQTFKNKFMSTSSRDILDYLNQYKPKPDDLFIVEPGLIHATFGELLFFEIQQPSDYTFRLYDFERQRPLHLSQALGVVKKNKPVYVKGGDVLRNDKFSLEQINLTHKKSPSLQTERPFTFFTYLGQTQNISIMTPLSRETDNSRVTLSVSWGTSFLFIEPAAIEFSAAKGVVFLATP